MMRYSQNSILLQNVVFLNIYGSNSYNSTEYCREEFGKFGIFSTLKSAENG